MLFFDKEEVEISQKKATCSVCERRRSMWLALERDSEEKAFMCGWCVLYSNESSWGYKNREEILYVGKAAQEQAVKHFKPIPVLDERGRLSSQDSERFLLGVVFTGKMISKLGPSMGFEVSAEEPL